MEKYTVEVPYCSEEDCLKDEAFRRWLIDSDLHFDVSHDYGCVLYDIDASPADIIDIDAALDRLVWIDD